MTVKDEYLALFRQRRAERLSAIDRDSWRTFLDGGDLAALRAERRSLLDFPATVKATERAELVAQWPADFAPLPEWFVRPETVEAPGEPCIVECKPQRAAEQIAPSDEAAIKDAREAKAKEEDAARAA